jgi:Fe-S-cluster-containing dehydrogenase component/formate-dependent nitrite reductase membrane component NrfD
VTGSTIGNGGGNGLPGVLGVLDADPDMIDFPSLPLEREPLSPRWGKVLDQSRCIGCHACTTACKSENEVPLGVTRTYVKSVDVGHFPTTRRAFQVTRCNMCADAPCVAACPTSAMYQREDGLVDFDKSICIGCKACIAACPYDAIFINPEDHSAEKCNFCSHRLEVGLEPACVVVCPVEAIFVGDLNDPASRVARTVDREPVSVRRPEKETRPKVFYKGATQMTLDPIAARRPTGDTYMWSEVAQGADEVVSGHPSGFGNSSAAALLSYDVQHKAPWDRRVSLYTWTKGVAAGVYLVAILLSLLDVITWTSPVLLYAAPAIGAMFLALTGALLVWDLSHPERFYMIFTRPQWRSWLVRGGFIIMGYGALLTGQFLAGALGWDIARWLAIAGIPLAIMTAIYTAYLFAQAKGRDLWQSPLLPPHMLVQAVLAGSAIAVLAATALRPSIVEPSAWIVAIAAMTHLGFVAGEVTLTHPTAHARLAVHEMMIGRYASFFWLGVVAVGVGVFAPLVPVLGAAAAAVGLLAHEHAYVQAGQAVPLA